MAKSVEQTYVKLTHLEQILLRPDTYVGSVESKTCEMCVFEAGRIGARKVTFVPGLYKIFDEILVNAADNKQRDPDMKVLKVAIDVGAGSISVYNDGAGIPVTMHKEHKCYVPELIFGHLLTSSNYDDSEQRTVGGRNGYGAKLANIFSTEFIVETADAKRGLQYRQVFSANMSVVGKPKISQKKSLKHDWTRITFKPDFARFGMPSGFDADTLALLRKRVYDVAGTFPKGMRVYMDGERLAVRDFKSYTALYAPVAVCDAPVVPRVFEAVNDRWQVCVTLSNGQFEQVSFVNGIATTGGGTHVNYIVDQVTRGVMDRVNKKNRGATAIKAHHIKNHLSIFVSALIDNPAFDSQTKDRLMTGRSKFGSKCVLSDAFLKRVLRTGLVESVTSWAAFRSSREMKRQDGKKKRRITGIPKLDDANDAGGRNGHACTLILTEGDSAKALAVSGLSVVGRDRYGVFPLKGKLLNVLNASHKQILGNQEITHLKQILGLKQGQVYKDASSLRYGHVLIMTDQDYDGSHIKGLLINFFLHFWPSLLEIPGFLREFITPIVKCTRGKKTVCHYTVPQYEAWRRVNADGRGWTAKYYKGLGTSTAAEAKAYFSDMDRHLVDFNPVDAPDAEAISLAFSKKKADARKQWLLSKYTADLYLDQDVDSISVTDFVNRELILFSMASNVRAIPSVMDGLKPGQRKILYCCFKRRLKIDIKVAQLAGYVSEHSAYHHGEASLQSTIVGMAQNYVGSNNVNWLVPSGMFGTRLEGGKDAASVRYIFTRLDPVTRAIFPVVDDVLLEHMEDDGDVVEPRWYAPTFPTVLMNGAAGIGTGWSTNVPQYRPRDVIAAVRHKIKTQSLDAPVPPHPPLTPWYRGFRGTIEATKPGSYTVRGCVEQLDALTLLITELPLQRWTSVYKAFLDSLLVNGTLADLCENHTDVTVSFTIKFSSAEKLAAMQKTGLHKALRLEGRISTANMVLFNLEGRIHRYTSPEEIVNEFFPARLALYVKRKAALIRGLEEDVLLLDNKVRFIRQVVSGELVIKNVPRASLLKLLASSGYAPRNAKSVVESVAESDEKADAVVQKKSSDYDYLLGMALWSLTAERVTALLAECARKQSELNKVRETSPSAMWLRDLDCVDVELEAWERRFNSAASKSEKRKRAPAKKSEKKSVKKPRKASKKPVKKKPVKKSI